VGDALARPSGGGDAATHAPRYLRVGVDTDKAAAELVAFLDANQPGIVLGLDDAQLQQLLKHDGYLDAVGSGQGIELQGMFAAGQFPLVGGPGDGPVDVGELAAVVLIPGPDPWWHVG